MARIIQNIIFDLKSIWLDLNYIINGFTISFKKFNFTISLRKYLTRLNNLRKYIFKKYIYTINHKRIAINYFFFSMWTGLSGAALATMIRLELAYPGSSFFKGDSLRYLQVITAHGLIMVFFVVVPILFGGFANFLIPYHVGSKDVAFPRLNSIGFWIQPCGYLLIAKTAFLRPQFWRYYDKPSFYAPLLDKANYRKFSDFKVNTDFSTSVLSKMQSQEGSIFWSARKRILIKNYDVFLFIPLKLIDWVSVLNYSESFWYSANRVVRARRKKVYFTKCSNRTLTLAGWAFITPFSSNT